MSGKAVVTLRHDNPDLHREITVNSRFGLRLRIGLGLRGEDWIALACWLHVGGAC